MKIMTVITGMRSGGAERVMATLCNELVKKHSVKLVCLKDSESDYVLHQSVLIDAGNITNRSFIKSVKFVAEEIDGWKPDVVLAFMNKANVISLVAKKISSYQPPVVVAERANPNFTSSYMKLMRRILYPSADGAVFQTKQAEQYYKGILKCKTVVLRNPLNPDFNIKPYDGIRRKVIVSVGRLSEEKNQALLIESFSRIATKHPEYNVEIYGDGPSRSVLQDQIDHSGLSERVRLMGRKDRVLDYIQDAGIFVLPSNSEGMPNALIEAMALGIPSIATDCPIGGSAFIIRDHGNGILVPMNDPVALSAAISEIIDNKSLSDDLSVKAREVTVDFAAETVCNEWEKYLNSVVMGVRKR